MLLQTASNKFTVGNKTRLFSTPFHVSTSSRHPLAGAPWNDNIAAYNTAPRGATEENESDGYVTIPCPSKVTQHSSTADCLKFS